MERRRRITLTGIDSDCEGTKPYAVRLICSIRERGKLVVWGHDDETRNVAALRNATFPCTILCLTTTPPRLSHVPQSDAWVHPHDYLLIV
jgi:hypothetical protein